MGTLAAQPTPLSTTLSTMFFSPMITLALSTTSPWNHWRLSICSCQPLLLVNFEQLADQVPGQRGNPGPASPCHVVKHARGDDTIQTLVLVMEWRMFVQQYVENITQELAVGLAGVWGGGNAAGDYFRSHVDRGAYKGLKQVGGTELL